MIEPLSALPPIELKLQQKQQQFTQGHLSEIGEEPGNVLSTDINASPSVEPEISRISSNQSASGLHNNLQQTLAQRESSEPTKTSQEEAKRDTPLKSNI